MSCIHYKFKSSLDYNSVTFDGLHLSLGDLKKAISAQKRLKPGEYDLEITNAQTGDVYKKLDELIAKNTSVIVSRVPTTKTTASSTQKSWEAFKQECAAKKEKERQMNLEKMKQTQDLASSHASEIDKIKAVIDMSTKGFEPASLPGRHPLAVPSDSYTCKRCGKKGHFVSHCPNVKSEDRILEPRVKRTTGIPSTMLTIVDDPLHPGALLTSHGQFAVPNVDVEAYKESKKERPPFLPDNQSSEPEKKKIPQELLCHICEDLCVDAAIAPCCGTSFCDECLRGELLESDDHQCPSCHETNVSPDRIVANRSMRIAVTNFLNDTGYTKVKRRRSSSLAGDNAPANDDLNVNGPQPASNANALTTSSASIIATQSTISSIGIKSSLDDGETTRPSHNSQRGTRYGDFNHNSSFRHNFPPSHGYRPRYWPSYREPFGHRNFREEGPRFNRSRPHSYNQSDKNPWEVKPELDVEKVATQAVHAVQAALMSQGHPGLNVPPPRLSFTGYPPMYARPEAPQNVIVPPQVPYAPSAAPVKSEDEFYKTQKMGLPSTLSKKSVDVFDSFADLTRMRSPTPELRSRSTSPNGTPPKKKSRSRTKSPMSHRSRGSSARRALSRSRSQSRQRSIIRSRSRSQPRSSPHLSRSQNRSRSRSPGRSRLSKVRSSSKSPHRHSKLRSRSPSKSRLSKARSRSFSPLPPLRRSSKSHSPRRSSKSPLPRRSKSPLSRRSKSPLTRRSSKSPLPLRPRSRSRSYKRAIRSRSWSRPRRSRSRSYSPLLRSPKRSPRRSPRRFSRSLTPRRSFSPRRRSRSFTPRKRSPYRSRTRSPRPQKRFSRSLSKSPRASRRSYSPLGSRRSKSPYRRPLSPLPSRKRSPSPHYGNGGGYRGRGRGRGAINRDGYRNDRPRHLNSPPRHAAPNTSVNRPPLPPPSNLPPVPYLPDMGLPPPEEFFKYNPAGYEEFVRTFYAQLGVQPNAWDPQQGHLPPPPVNPFPPGQVPAQMGHPGQPGHPGHPGHPTERGPWGPAPGHMPPTHRPPPQPTAANRFPKHGDFAHKDSARHYVNDGDREREEMVRGRRVDERRYDNRRGDSRERRFHNKDRRDDFRDKRGDDRDRKYDERDKRMDDKERRGDRGRDTEKRRDRIDSDKSRDRESEKTKDKDSGRTRDKVSSESKKSPQRKNSKEHEKNKSKERKRSDKDKKEGKEKTKGKVKSEKESTKEVTATKDTHGLNRIEENSKNDTHEMDTKPFEQPKSSNAEKENDSKSGTTLANAEKSQNEPTALQPKPDQPQVKEKKVVGKKKAGTLGLKKVKVKDATSDGAAAGEKKIKKTKKKKLTFGASDADSKQGLKKKKLKRLVDYKSESNCMSEDGDHERSNVGVSPLKKAKIEDAANSHDNGPEAKDEKALAPSFDDLKPGADELPSKDATSSPHQRMEETDAKQSKDKPEEVKSELIPELPELSKWERDDFDLLDTLESPKKPKEKMMVPRSIVDKAEKFLSQKPMKNSVVAPALSQSNRSDDKIEPAKHRRSRSKSPVSKPARKVYMDSRRDSKDKKSMDIQITVKSDRRRNESSRRDDTYRRPHQHSGKEQTYEEDERSVVKSNSLERDLRNDRSPQSHRNKKSGSKLERTSSRDKSSKHDHSNRDDDKHHNRIREKSPPARNSEKDRHPRKDDRESNKSTKDLRAKIEEKTKLKNNVENRRMSVMDESEFVPDYEDLASDNEHTSQTSGASSHDEKESRKRKSEEEKEDDDPSSIKHKKTKKKHKHKEKKEKKEKHKHKKKKHKQKKSKEKEV